MTVPSTPRPVLLLGGTGRTGGRTLTALLARGIPVRAVVRSASRLPDGVQGDPLLTVVEGEVLAMPRTPLAAAVEGCDAVVCALGHPLSLRGVFGSPRHLVEDALRRVCDLALAEQPVHPLRVVLMGSVSVNRPHHADSGRGRLERAVLAVLRAVLPPARDNQRAADLLALEYGPAHPDLSWVVARPDTLGEGERTVYDVHPEPRTSIFRPADTAMANVADFMAELVHDRGTWARWAGQLPVITDAA